MKLQNKTAEPTNFDFLYVKSKYIIFIVVICYLLITYFLVIDILVFTEIQI